MHVCKLVTMTFKFFKFFLNFKNVVNNIICFIDNTFYFKLIFITTNKYNVTSIQILLIHYSFESGETHTHTPKKPCWF
jgi:hypothetical protein